MKKIILSALVLGTLVAHAQNCDNFIFFKKGKTIEMTVYDKSGAPSGTKTYQVLDATTSGGTATATLVSEIFDKTGKSIGKANTNVKCVGGEIMIDMKMAMSPQQNQQTSNADAKMDAAYLDYPSTVHTGDQLKDGNFTMQVTVGNMQQTFNISITDRKVGDKESVTTSAGTWDCYKITSKNTTVMNMGGRSMPFSVDLTEWYAPGFAIIKTQSQNGGTAITAIK